MMRVGFLFCRSALENFVLSGAFIIEKGGTVGNCRYNAAVSFCAMDTFATKNKKVNSMIFFINIFFVKLKVTEQKTVLYFKTTLKNHYPVFNKLSIQSTAAIEMVGQSIGEPDVNGC